MIKAIWSFKGESATTAFFAKTHPVRRRTVIRTQFRDFRTIGAIVAIPAYTDPNCIITYSLFIAIIQTLQSQFFVNWTIVIQPPRLTFTFSLIEVAFSMAWTIVFTDHVVGSYENRTIFPSELFSTDTFPRKEVTFTIWHVGVKSAVVRTWFYRDITNSASETFIAKTFPSDCTITIILELFYYLVILLNSCCHRLGIHSQGRWTVEGRYTVRF